MGCSDYLSEIQDNRTAIDSKEKISELLVNAYPDRNYMEFAETMSDNVFDSGSASLNNIFNTSMYNWEIPIGVDLDKPQSYWNSCYRAISYSNQALEAITKLGDTPDLKPQKAEALLTRAYAHFMLVHFWSKAYNPATAATDLGIPYVLKPETELLVNYKRNTVKEVYDYIKADLEEGLKYVTNNYKEKKYHFNKEAANAFASRFYLSIGQWDKVLEVSADLALNTDNKFRD
jgi:hypothetical protein